jgi:hypothetical protein
MGNGENLRPTFIPPTKEQARINGLKGGKITKERKSLQQSLIMLLQMPIAPGEPEDVKNLLEARGKNVTVQDALMLAQIVKAKKGDTRAFQALMQVFDKAILVGVNIGENKAIRETIDAIKGFNDDDPLIVEEVIDDGN